MISCLFLFRSTTNKLKIEYAAGFNISQTSSTAALTTKLTEEGKKTNLVVDTKTFYGKIVPDSIGVTRKYHAPL